MGRVIAVLNQKGGVGKTSTVLGIASDASGLSGSVLLIDTDPQASLTAGIMPEGFDPEYTVTDIYASAEIEAGDADAAIVQTPWPGVDLIAADRSLLNREVDPTPGMVSRLATGLKGVTDRYDLVLIDCPPAGGRLTIGALLASDGVLLVTEPARGSVSSLDLITETIEKTRAEYQHDVPIVGVLVNKMERTNVAARNREVLVERYGDLLLGDIPKRAAIAEAYDQGIPLLAVRSTGGFDAMMAFSSARARLDGLNVPPFQVLRRPQQDGEA